MAAVSLLVQKFEAAYARKPILTTMITNAVLGGIADTTAQIISSVRTTAVRKPGGVQKDDTLAIEIHELDRKNPWPPHDIVPDSSNLPPPFDFERLIRFMSYGFLMAPLQYKWFGFLSRTFPATKASGTMPAIKRVAFDQLIFAPMGMLPPSARGGSALTRHRSRRVLYIHDHCRRWRAPGTGTEVPGRLCADA